MKKQLSIASALVAASSFSHGEIKLNEYLSVEGFVIADYSVAESNLGGNDESDNFFGVAEVEIDWLFKFDRVGGRIDLQHEHQADGRRIERGELVEQAFVTYELWDSGTLTAGRYASMLGYEDFERPGLHQQSYAYDLQLTQFNTPGFGIIVPRVGVLPGYNQGLKYTHESQGTFFGVSIQDSVFNYDNFRFGGDDVSSYGVEVAGSFQLAEGLRWFLGGAYEDTDIQDSDTNYLLNTYVSYETGPWTFGAELNYGKSESGLFALSDLLSFIADDDIGIEEKVVQGLIVANYAYSDNASITGRISYSEHKDDEGLNVEAEAIKFTLAHKYAFSDNLALINEVSYVDGDLMVDGDTADFDSVVGAATLLFTF